MRSFSSTNTYIYIHYIYIYRFTFIVVPVNLGGACSMMIDGIRGGIFPRASSHSYLAAFTAMYNTYRQYLSVNAVRVSPVSAST